MNPISAVRLRNSPLPEAEIYGILSNERRFEALRLLNDRSGEITVAALAEAIARTEVSEGRPSKSARDSVYASLHGTHLPKLHDLGLVHYDRDRRVVEPLDRVREVDRYMEVVTSFGFTWGEYYRALGVLGVCAVLGSLVEVPGLQLVDPVLLCTVVLCLYAVSSAYQLWSHPMPTGLGRYVHR